MPIRNNNEQSRITMLPLHHAVKDGATAFNNNDDYIY